MEVKTYSHNKGMRFTQEGLCIVGEGFVAKRGFGEKKVYLQPRGRKGSMAEFVSASEAYLKDKLGIWNAGFNRGYFPEHLDPNSEEAKVLNRLSRPTIRERFRGIAPCLENAFYLMFA